MKIIKLREFLKLKNVLYTTFTDGEVGDTFYLKRESYRGTDGEYFNDWSYEVLAPHTLEMLEGELCWSDLQERVVKSSISGDLLKLDLTSRTSRWGVYPDDEELFCVYDSNDVKHFVGILNGILQGCEKE